MPLSGRVTAFLAGVGSHVLYFRRGEHHTYGLFYMTLFTASLVTGTASLQSLHTSFSIHTSFLAGLYTSLIAYRLSPLHPLSKFPGPLHLRISALCFSGRVGPRADACKYVLDLHNRHGPIVRIGPNDLSAVRPDIVQLVHGNRSECTKNERYDLFKTKSLHTTRDKALHARRRRVWTPAFSGAAVKGYETRIRPYQDRLLSKCLDSARGPAGKTWIDVSREFSLYSSDVLGDLAFGTPVSRDPTQQTSTEALEALMAGRRALALMLPPWVFQLALSIPGAAKGAKRWLRYCAERMLERIESPPPDSDSDRMPDISSALLAPSGGKKPADPDEMEMLVGDANLIFGAGRWELSPSFNKDSQTPTDSLCLLCSETTASTLTAVFYLLARHPEHFFRLKQEIMPLVDQHQGQIPDDSKLATLKHLNAVINEALRLFPPVMTMWTRKTPPQGLHLADGTHIPGAVNIWTPQYAMGRSEANWTEANRFMPERWHDDASSEVSANLKTAMAVYVPFSAGELYLR